MTIDWLSFDLLLAIALVALATASLRARDLFKGVVLFMLFGLLVAIAWVRVHAPDLALAEAAIGSGITGALFLGVLSRLEKEKHEAVRGQTENPIEGFASGAWAVLLTATLTGVLMLAVTQVWRYQAGLADAVLMHLDQSGVLNPVTAVILNFRAYDTMLEIGVLLLAVLGVYVVAEGHSRDSRERRARRSEVLEVFVHLLTPVVILTAGYLVWIGYRAPGGAFQAGALLGGIGVVLLLAGHDLPLSSARALVRVILGGGFLGFLLAGLLVLRDGALLEYPRQSAKHIILLIELLCTTSIGAILTVLFAGCASLLTGARERKGE
jgi:multisubunit Na+/H+ antiporter MnhB subunit